jgi:phosphate transport system protein
MSIHLQRDLEALQRELLHMCTEVTDVVHQGVAALGHPDPEFTRTLMAHDDDIDQSDVQLEEACLKMLALHQPVASDLRRITAVLKITAELERIADLGVNIAERAAALASLPTLALPKSLELMSEKALSMLDRSIAAYVNLDSAAARVVCSQDDEVDELNRQIIVELTGVMQRSPELIPTAMHLFSACRNVERVADHATNIAEDIIYLVEGEIVRHQPELLRVHRESA